MGGNGLKKYELLNNLIVFPTAYNIFNIVKWKFGEDIITTRSPMVQTMALQQSINDIKLNSLFIFLRPINPTNWPAFAFPLREKQCHLLHHLVD